MREQSNSEESSKESATPETPWQDRVVFWTSVALVTCLPLIMGIFSILAGKIAPLVIIDALALIPVAVCLILRSHWKWRAIWLILAFAVGCVAGAAFNGQKFGVMMSGVIAGGLASTLFGWRSGIAVAIAITCMMAFEAWLALQGFISPATNLLPGETLLSGWIRGTGSFLLVSLIFVAIFSVITSSLERRVEESRRLASERQELIKILQRKNAELERFTYVTSHDLKSPLVTIKLLSGMLESETGKELPSQAQGHIGRIMNAADRMLNLLDDLLYIARLGNAELDRAPVSMRAAALAAIQNLEGNTLLRGVGIHVDDIPDAIGEERRVIEVWQNLIENAIKYMGDEKKPQVRIGCRIGGSSAIYFVEDNGMGIDPQYAERIFMHLEKLNPESEGSGMGLAIAKKIVEAQGGRIWVEGTPSGKGSTFCFTIEA
ncbi:MAG: hypothetical protein JNM27_17005 [Leptospirales bacterium]|nr:hypothetical protein [Leptospirales bacterium]